MVFWLTSLVSASLGLKAAETLIFGLWCLLQIQQPDFCAALHMFTHKNHGLLFPTNLCHESCHGFGAAPHVCLARIWDGRCVIRPAWKCQVLPQTLGDNAPYAGKDGWYPSWDIFFFSLQNESCNISHLLPERTPPAHHLQAQADDLYVL